MGSPPTGIVLSGDDRLVGGPYGSSHDDDFAEDDS